jgi:hypothetical protein
MSIIRATELPVCETSPVPEVYADNLFSVEIFESRARFICTVVEQPKNGEPFLRPVSKNILPVSAVPEALFMTAHKLGIDLMMKAFGLHQFGRRKEDRIN